MGTGGALIGSLRVSLGLDSAQFEAGTKRARGIADRDAKAIEGSFSGIKGAFASILSVATVGVLVAAGKRALDYAGSLGEVAQQLGVSSKALQEYRFIGSQVGIEQEDMDRSLAKLTRSLGDAAAGAKKPADAFKDLGIDIRHVTAEDALPKLADAFSRIKDPATRAAYEVTLFGKAGQKLDTLLAGGSAAIKQMTDEAQRLGLVISDDLIKKADDASDTLSKLVQVMESQLAVTVAENADAITGLANAFIAATEAAGAFFRAIRGNERIGKEEGFLASITDIGGSGEAATPQGWFNRKQRQFVEAQNLLRAAEKGEGGGISVETRKKALSAAAAARDRASIELFQSQAPGKPPLKPESTDRVVHPPKGPKGTKDRSEEIAARFDKELASLQGDQLQLQEQITTDVRKRAGLEHQRIQTAQDAFDHETDSRALQGDFGTDKKLAEERAKELKLAYAANAAREHTLVNWRLDDELTSQELDTTRSQLENSTDLLRGEMDAARTQEERRRIQLQILENETELQRATLEAVIAKHESTEAEKEIAQKKLDQLEAEKGQRTAAINRETAGPLEDWLNRVPKTAAEFKETMESIDVRGLDTAADDMASMVTNALKLHGAMGQAVEDVVRLIAKMIEARAINMFGGSKVSGAAKGGGSDFLSSIMSAFSMIAGGKGEGLGASIGSKVPGLATGGSFMANGIGGIDRNVLAINGIPRVRVSDTERVSITPANDRGSNGNSPIVFDMRGAVMTQDLLAQMEGIAARGDAQVLRTGARGAARSRAQALA